MSPYRIILAYPGGEAKLFEYKRAVPDYQAATKVAELANQFLGNWQHCQDGEIIAAESVDNSCMILAASGPKGVRPFL